jgi:hypothetical protein
MKIPHPPFSKGGMGEFESYYLNPFEANIQMG